METDGDFPMFLLGAGASRDAGLPLAADITKYALDHINDESPSDEAALLNYIVSAIVGHNGRFGRRPDALPDIETVVSAVDLLIERDGLEIVPFVQAWDSAVSQIGVNEGYERLPTFSWTTFGRDGKHVDREQLQHFGEHVASFVQEQVQKRMRRSNNSVYLRLHAHLIQDLCRTLKTPDSSRLGYLHPLVQHAADNRLPITTLNYDLTVETACRSLVVAVDTGVSEWGKTGQVAFDPEALQLIKLHGSLGWTAGSAQRGMWSDRIDLTSTDPFKPVPPGEYEEPAVIYGKRGKLRAQGPFLELRQHFTRALEAADSLVVIGYSFHDDHVNEAIAAWLRRSVHRRIIVVDPGLTGEAVYESGNDFLYALHGLNPHTWSPVKSTPEPPRYFPIRRGAADAIPLLCQPTESLVGSLATGTVGAK